MRRSLLYCKMLPKINLLHFFDARDKFREFISQIYFENQLVHKLSLTIFLRSVKVTPIVFSIPTPEIAREKNVYSLVRPL